MADDVMALDERLARLEMTVATGFSELGARIGNVETGLDSVESRLRVLIEASRDEHRKTAEGFGATLERIEACLELMHQEHLQAQRDHAHLIGDHERRITALERRRPDSSRAPDVRLAEHPGMAVPPHAGRLGPDVSPTLPCPAQGSRVCQSTRSSVFVVATGYAGYAAWLS